MERGGIVFVVNYQSGRGKGSEYEGGIKEWCRARGFDPLVIPTSKDGPNSAFALGKRAAEAGVAKFVAFGGDGTFSLAVSGMMASGVAPEKFPTLGFIQGGIGNNFAKNIGIPKGFEEEMRVIFHGKTALVDVGVLTIKKKEKYFLNVVSFGFDAEITEAAKGLKEKCFFIPKSLTYGLTAVWEIFQGLPYYRVKLTGQGFDFDIEASLVAVLNGPTYGAIFKIAPGADLSDGLFDVYLIDKISNDTKGKKRAVKILLCATKGTHIGLPEVSFYRTPFLTVSSPRPLPCEADGEVLPAEKKYEISILPRTLKVLVSPPVLAAQRSLVSKVEAPEFQSV